MKYVGGKSKMAKYIVPILQNLINSYEIETYIEPFCGGNNILRNIKCRNRYGYDNNKYIIELYKEIQNGWEPWNDGTREKITKDVYMDIKSNKNNYPESLVGLVGTLCSYCATWFGGYANTNKKDCGREYFAESLRGLAKDKPLIQDVKFKSCDYHEVAPPHHALVYCDPPYNGTSNNYHCKFDSFTYWNWIRKISQDPIYVICSEINAPDDFIEIFRKESNYTLYGAYKRGSSKDTTEKLFIYSESYYKDRILKGVGLQ